MKNPVLQLSRLSAPGDQRLADAFDLVFLKDQKDPQGFLEEQGHRFQVAVTTAPVGASADVMAALPNLKAVVCRGIGVEKVDFAYANAHGVAVSSTPDVLTECVADLAMGLMIDTLRGLSASDRFVRQGRWPQGAYPLTSRVWGKRLGILGCGQIGQAIAQRAQGFRMAIGYHNRRRRDELDFEYFASPVALAQWADVLMVVVTGGEQTEGLVDQAVLQALGSEGCLVNVARGSVIDEPALVQALQAKTIAGAGLDVFVDEPQVPTELMSLDNVVLLPHIGSGTHETRRAMEDLVFDNVQAFFQSGRLLTPVLG
jgi:hydroxypyruvate reductase